LIVNIFVIRVRAVLRKIVARLSVPIFYLAFWLYRRFDLRSEMQSSAERSGVDVLKRHYYSPVPDAADFNADFWNAQSELIGLKLSEETGFDIVDDTIAPYLDEFRKRYPLTPDSEPGAGFHLLNGVYMAVDAHVYYALIRALKPARIIEIGAGQSARLALDAAAENKLGGRATALTCIEPYPSAFLRESTAITLLESKLQDVDLSLFNELQANDILFIDSTHVLREGNDVQCEYLEILPRLNDGVLVHIHDISLPRRYPRAYFDAGWYWNEQYLLQAFLAFNDHFDIIWPGNFMMTHQAPRMLAIFPEITAMRELFPQSEPSAFWMRVKDH
jgi:hypothetical protein